MKLRPKDLREYRIARLQSNEGLCELCSLPIEEGKAVLDHDHADGLVRGVIHRSCNSVLGKIERGRRYGKEFSPIDFALGVGLYLTKTHGNLLHPTAKVHDAS